MNRGVKRIGIAIAVIAVLYIGIVGVGGGLLLAYALTPGMVDWSQSMQPVPSDPFEINYRGDPKTALGFDFETIHYDTELGRAEAWLVPGRPSTVMAIFVHGIGGIRENGYRQLSILHEAGIPVLMITYRNDRGAPVAKPPLYALGLTEWRDLDAAAGWALGHGATRIILVAESMGGGIAGQFLVHSPHAGQTEALVLDAPATDLTVIADWMLDQFHLPLGDQLAVVAMRVASIRSGEPLASARVLDQIEKFPGPVFVAQGRSDRLVPVTLTRRLIAARTGPTTYLETDADHLHSFKVEPQRYRAELLAFLAALPKG